MQRTLNFYASFHVETYITLIPILSMNSVILQHFSTLSTLETQKKSCEKDHTIFHKFQIPFCMKNHTESCVKKNDKWPNFSNFTQTNEFFQKKLSRVIQNNCHNISRNLILESYTTKQIKFYDWLFLCSLIVNFILLLLLVSLFNPNKFWSNFDLLNTPWTEVRTSVNCTPAWWNLYSQTKRL